MQLRKFLLHNWGYQFICMVVVISLSGCYAPLHSPGFPASNLPDSFRLPSRRFESNLNLSNLVAPQPSEYLLGPGDILDVTIPNLTPNVPFRAIRVKVQDNGMVQIPGIGIISVKNQTLSSAQKNLNLILANGLLVKPKSSITLFEKGTVNVLVLGEVASPGIHALPRFENDIAHALAAANGFTEEAGDFIEVHRKQPVNNIIQPENDSIIKYGHSIENLPPIPESELTGKEHCSTCLTAGGLPAGPVLKIPLRGDCHSLKTEDVILNPGDVIVIPPVVKEVFYVVGNLSDQNRARFTLGDEEREIGNGFLLPKNRDIDVVTAVAMAGYIDPINSPTTVTVHRVQQDGMPFLIHVDLLKARMDRLETVMVQPGDIIYLNPDMQWWFRRTLDRTIDRALGTAIGRWLTN